MYQHHASLNRNAVNEGKDYKNVQWHIVGGILNVNECSVDIDRLHGMFPSPDLQTAVGNDLPMMYKI